MLSQGNECGLKSRPHGSSSLAPPELHTSKWGSLSLITRGSLWPGGGPALDIAEHRRRCMVEIKRSMSTTETSTSPETSPTGHVAEKGVGALSSELDLDLDLGEQTGLGPLGEGDVWVCPGAA